MLVDYLVYAGNSAIVSREGIVTQEYALEGNLIIIFREYPKVCVNLQTDVR